MGAVSGGALEAVGVDLLAAELADEEGAKVFEVDLLIALLAPPPAVDEEVVAKVEALALRFRGTIDCCGASAGALEEDEGRAEEGVDKPTPATSRDPTPVDFSF